MSETIQLGHLEVESPFGNAGGVVKSIEDVEVMARSGVGWIEPGSYTYEGRDGNDPDPEDPKIVYVHDPFSGRTWNSLGMPNKGKDKLKDEIPVMAGIAHKHGKPLIVNVAPVSDEPAPETEALVAWAYEEPEPMEL